MSYAGKHVVTAVVVAADDIVDDVDDGDAAGWECVVGLA